jgi:23S rRNA G2445 N2-methylase RlmL
VVPGAQGPFAVSASFLGRRKFSRFDVEDLVGAQITGGIYHSRRTGAVPPAERVDWRVVLDGQTLWVAVRPFAVPLHRRVWRRQTVVGSLHPPVAAAMAGLAGITAGHRVLDPFCGAGTLLLEAHAIESGASYLGIDRQPAALAAARANTAGRAPITWRAGDAAGLSGPVDRILTNPPWDVRVRLGDFAPYLREWRRVLRPGGRVVTILNQEQAARMSADAAWRVLETYDVAVAGQHPRIVVAEALT